MCMPLHEEYQITYSLNFYIMIWAAICRPPCENGGECVRPGYCSCRNGFHGDRCQLGSYALPTTTYYVHISALHAKYTKILPIAIVTH